jgi:type IV pilus assembly protein PilB
MQFDETEQDKRITNMKEQEEEALLSYMAETQFDLPYVNLFSLTIDNDALRVLDEAEARRLGVGPYKLIGKRLSLAVQSPTTAHTQEAYEILTKKGYEVQFHIASHKSIEKVWSRYADLQFSSASRTGGITITADIIAELSGQITSIEEARKIITEVLTTNEKGYHISKLLEIIVGAGIALGASDIHIEPEEDSITMRFRLDGILQEITSFHHDVYKMINTRIKLLSGLKLTITEAPQDGRFSSFMMIDEKEEEINYRTSLIPGAYGESIVLRILNPKSIRVKLEALGISAPLYELFMREIAKPNGMILLTGPTGSGKTTTLYAFLQKIYSSEKKIITIEDPIEYHLPGITQTQTDHKKGYTFLSGLRSALRQDPDVIMVGEIRDSETAKIAVESALTGHLVFSTLHTNNAGGVIPRLIDLEVNPKILVSALSLSIAQRLVRTLCSNCKAQAPLDETQKRLIETIWNGAIAKGKKIEGFGVSKDVTSLYKAVGCGKCNGTGYKGRVGVFEVVQTNESIERIITESPSERDIKTLADKQGYLDMREDGLVKILQGITDFEEIGSVVDLEE